MNFRVLCVSASLHKLPILIAHQCDLFNTKIENKLHFSYCIQVFSMHNKCAIINTFSSKEAKILWKFCTQTTSINIYTFAGIKAEAQV